MEVLELANKKLGKTSTKSNSTVRKYTPENITTLEPNQVFVFGANTAGGHGGGTAGLAQRGVAKSNYTALPKGTKGKWAEYGIIDQLMEGTEGKSFGIVTKAATVTGTRLKIGSKRSVTLERIEQSINALIETANNNPKLEFLVTKFGTNMAGFTIAEMKGLLENKSLPDNIILPKEFETRSDSKNTQKEKEDTGSEKMSIETFKEEIKKIIDKKQQENFESEEAAEAFMNSDSLQSAVRIVKDSDIFNTVSQEELNRIISDLENC
jgi:hypothetical protein